LRIRSFPGERIDAAGLLELANVGEMQAVAEVYEGDVGLLSRGLRAKVMLDASGEELSGVVSEIRQTDLRAAETEIDAARAAVETARAELSGSELKAPISGRVLRIRSFPGERIDAAGLLELANVGEMQAVAEVYEGDVGLLSRGLRAKV
ncbi:MAG: hypothetical protein ACKPJJ_07520, partial [Planctomycetaceae bacterium]